MMNSIELTKDWQRYQQGKDYNNRLDPPYYDNCSMNLDFYNGRQYPGLDDVDVPKPVFNIIKRLVTYFVSSAASNKTVVNVEPMAYVDDDTWVNEVNASKLINAHIDNLFESLKMQMKIREALTDGCTMGDYCAHIYFDTEAKPYGGMLNPEGVEGEMCIELIDGSNVYFGNPNNKTVDKKTQPYIILSGRDTVENLQKEAEQYKVKNVSVESDEDFQEQVGQGGKIEIEADEKKTNKATYLIIYKPSEDGKTILVSKSVKNLYIYEDVDTGLEEYPVAWGVWEAQKNQYHGSALVTGLIPNQIYINRAFGILMYFLMNNAFPKPIYDADKVAGWTSEIGVALPVYNMQPGESIRNVAAYLEYGQANPQVVETINLAKSMTLELAGATEAALGNVKPDNTSAIIAVTKQAAVPLENPRANLKNWVSDIVTIMLDVMATKYGVRNVVIQEEGQKIVRPFDFSQLKNLNLNTTIQVGDGSYFSEVAAIQTLDNLLSQDRISAMQYFERIEKVNPDYIPDIQGLIEDLKQMELAQQTQQFDEQALIEFVQTLPEDVQSQLAQLPEAEMYKEVQTMMALPQ